MSSAMSIMTALTLLFVVPITLVCTLTNVYTEKRARKTIVITISNATRGVVMTTSALTSSTAIKAVRKIPIVTQPQHQTAAVKAIALTTSSVKETKSMEIIVIKTQNVSLDIVM